LTGPVGIQVAQGYEYIFLDICISMALLPSRDSQTTLERALLVTWSTDIYVDQGSFFGSNNTSPYLLIVAKDSRVDLAHGPS
jgi:hypothetical protein